MEIKGSPPTSPTLIHDYRDSGLNEKPEALGRLEDMPQKNKAEEIAEYKFYQFMALSEKMTDYQHCSLVISHIISHINRVMKMESDAER